MNYTAGTKPGMGDPYWYEWSVGLNYIIEMLNPDNEIKYVELQADVSLGLDDVVVTYENGKKIFIQVKHTRVDDTLTFGDLVTKNDSNRRSLLQELAIGWNKEKENCIYPIVRLFTNRIAGKKISPTKTNPSFRRPSLSQFIPELQAQVDAANSFEDIQFPEFEKAWEEWCRQLESLESDSDRLSFLRSLEIDTGNSDLSKLRDELIQKLKTVFQTNNSIADSLLMKLDHALRIWSTSDRVSPRIDKEEVYNQLSIIQEYISYNQDLVPSEPFFPSRETLVVSLEKELCSNQHKIIFLSGIPGTGKTNIISKLSAKKESKIDIRYYAYEPINPEKEYFTGDVSRRVDKDYFWNELFNQLRKKLKGQLYKYRVPVVNELMTLEEKRKRFFEIASMYANDRGKDFIVAIDGIDHAARATNIENTFLPTLPNPEYIPSKVKLIIAGQPKSDYRYYPDWLISDNTNVVEINVPALLIEDIQSLVDVRFEGKSIDYRKQLSELISRYAEGNTLAAIFAVYEAIKEPTLYDLEKNLKERKLSGNIHEYYRTIWDNAIQRIKTLFVDYKVAGVFAFLNEPVNEKKLCCIYQNEHLSESDWRNVLKNLQPLLFVEAGNFTILHNDIRVFLSNIIGQDQDHVQEVYSNLVDYYISLPEKNVAYYRDVLRFMKASGRLNEFEKVLSPEFIIAAYVHGVEIDEISGIALDIIKEVKAELPINWDYMRSLAFGYMTINQIKKSQDEIDSYSFRENNHTIPIHPYECYVEDRLSWNNLLIAEVLSLNEKLNEAGQFERANGLFKRWFSDLNTSELYKIIKSDEDKEFLSPSTQIIARQLGAGICRSGKYDMFEGTKELAENHSIFVAYMMDSALETIIKENSGELLEKALSQLPIFYPDSLLDSILVMLSDNRLDDIYTMANSLNERLNKNPVGVLLATFMKIVSLKVGFSIENKNEIWKLIEPIKFNVDYEKENKYYSIYALVAGFLQSKPSSTIAQEIVEKYIEKNQHRDGTCWRIYFNNVCLIGHWLSQRQKNERIEISPKSLKSLMSALFLSKMKSRLDYYEICKLRSEVLRAYIYLSRTEDDQICSVVDDICQKAFEDNPADYYLEPGFYFYRNNSLRQKQWFDDWLGVQGRVWNLSIGDRNSIINKFIRVVMLYDSNKNIDTTEVIEKAKWSVVGFGSHKEYICDYLFDWYNLFVEKHGTVDPDISKQVKRVSDLIEEVGDNRIEFNLNCKVFGDLFSCGFQIIKEAFQNNHFLSQGLESPGYLVDGLIGYLKDGNYTQETLLKIWAIGIAVLDWKDDENHATIHSLQKAIELCAERSGIQDIRVSLSKYGPAYIDLIPDPMRFIIPERWCDEKGKIIDDQISDRIILEYMEGDNISKECIVNSLDVLRKKGLVSTDTLIQLLEFELKKGKWNFERNQIIEYLFKCILPEYTDPLVDSYLDALIEDAQDYIETQLPLFARMAINQQDEIYCAEGIKELINMYKNWLTAGGHFQEPVITDNYDYVNLIDWNSVSDLDSLFYQILKILILSEDADAARTALSGLFALERINESFIKWIESDWSFFHYRAKEWIMMTYELLWDLEEPRRDLVQHCIEAHCADEDFIVALYANLLLENIKGDEYTYVRKDQTFFTSIPSFGARQIIRTPKAGPVITGKDYVVEAIEQLQELSDEECSDLEERTLVYADLIDKKFSPIPLNQNKRGWIKVSLDPIEFAFLRVMYKDWVNGRWNGVESEIARIILSASEPFVLLISPYLWRNNDHKLIKDTEGFINLSVNDENRLIKEIIESGIEEDEAILAGSIRDYTHNKEIFGFYLSYLNVPGMLSSYASHVFERCSRYFLQRRDDFYEDEHFNITLHHNGIESFSSSNVSCGISKQALVFYDWEIKLSSDGFFLVDAQGETIGYLDCFYAFKDIISNQYASAQPILQRWVIKKNALTTKRTWSIDTVVDSIIIPLS